MKYLVLFFGLAVVAHAELQRPELTVSAMISAAHSNNLTALFNTCDVVKIASHPRHGKSPAQLRSFLLSIDPKKVKYAPISSVDNGAPITVRMVVPVNMDFDLQPGPHSSFIVIGIHP